MLLIARKAPPVLLNATARGALLVPISWVPSDKERVERLASAGPASKFTVSIAKSVQPEESIAAQAVILKTTLVMLAPDSSCTPIYVASPATSLIAVKDPRRVAPLKA